MSNLWVPANIHSLPTPSETKIAKESIESLERQLQNALAVLLQAQHAVETLQKQIEERRAWIAPVRRISHDVLSLIFLEVCRMKWSAPLKLGQVCHVWWESIIISPTAWSYFQLRNRQSNEIRSLFISRSAPCSLHLRLPAHFDSRTPELLASVTERIQCLSLDMGQVWNLHGHRFPAIERLVIDGDGHANPDPSYRDPGFILNHDLFPCLRFLTMGTLLESIEWDTPPFPNVVPLQVLPVASQDTNVWSNIVECCSQSLTSLAVMLFPTAGIPVPSRKTISLPRLESLRINHARLISDGWDIDAQTPALQTYLEYSVYDGLVGPIHEDTQTVTSLHSNFDMDLSKFPQVRQMSLSPRALHKVVQRLVNTPAICPNLDTIVDDLPNDEYFLPLKNLLSARNKETGNIIRFRGSDDDGVILYQHPRDRNCGYNMPCAHRR